MNTKSKNALAATQTRILLVKDSFLEKAEFVPDVTQRERFYESYYERMRTEFRGIKRYFFEYHLDVDIHTLDSMLRAHGSVVEEMYGDGMSQEFMARMEAIWEEKD